MYQSHLQPCRAAIVFILRKVPARIPDVSEKASFYVICYILTGCTISTTRRTICDNCTVDSLISFPIPVVNCQSKDE